MNEINIENFIALTEQCLDQNQQALTTSDLDSINALFDDLSAKRSRRQRYDDLYR